MWLFTKGYMLQCLVRLTGNEPWSLLPGQSTIAGLIRWHGPHGPMPTGPTESYPLVKCGTGEPGNARECQGMPGNAREPPYLHGVLLLGKSANVGFSAQPRLTTRGCLGLWGFELWCWRLQRYVENRNFESFNNLNSVQNPFHSIESWLFFFGIPGTIIPNQLATIWLFNIAMENDPSMIFPARNLHLFRGFSMAFCES